MQVHDRSRFFRQLTRFPRTAVALGPDRQDVSGLRMPQEQCREPALHTAPHLGGPSVVGYGR